MLKQVLRTMAVLAVLLAVASPAWADNINVILDDPTPPGGGSLAYFLPPGASGPFNLVWQKCSPYPPVPPGEPAAGFLDCLAIVNNTGSALTHLILTIPDSNTQTFLCAVSGSSTGFGCSSSFSGGVATLDFSGIPGFVNNTEIFIGVGLPGQNIAGLGNPTLRIPTYDPGTLTLLAVGMAFLATGGVRRYA